MAHEDHWWRNTQDSLRLMQDALRHEANSFRLELLTVGRTIADYVKRGALLRNLSSIHPQLSRVLFVIGRIGLLAGIGNALRDEYPPVTGHLPERLIVLLKRL